MLLFYFVNSNFFGAINDWMQYLFVGTGNDSESQLLVKQYLNSYTFVHTVFIFIELMSNDDDFTLLKLNFDQSKMNVTYTGWITARISKTINNVYTVCQKQEQTVGYKEWIRLNNSNHIGACFLMSGVSFFKVNFLNFTFLLFRLLSNIDDKP